MEYILRSFAAVLDQRFGSTCTFFFGRVLFRLKKETSRPDVSISENHKIASLSHVTGVNHELQFVTDLKDKVTEVNIDAYTLNAPTMLGAPQDSDPVSVSIGDIPHFKLTDSVGAHHFKTYLFFPRIYAYNCRNGIDIKSYPPLSILKIFMENVFIKALDNELPAAIRSRGRQASRKVSRVIPYLKTSFRFPYCGVQQANRQYTFRYEIRVVAKTIYTPRIHQLQHRLKDVLLDTNNIYTLSSKHYTQYQQQLFQLLLELANIYAYRCDTHDYNILFVIINATCATIPHAMGQNLIYCIYIFKMFFDQMFRNINLDKPTKEFCLGSKAVQLNTNIDPLIDVNPQPSIRAKTAVDNIFLRIGH
ncbi:hypothetical protein BDF20DRAFT_914003 [Mycotypha africana]|uniref:uncharacterized protein n=1 Tax=Mycotypha africana TaxID=64632 RepID=UPI002301D96A|nr:uncharacterized protein BDF20DRAFT_914003 [Mycotypha africana]KAI8977697.1 hypothetical protein BDF20DRAFT_914003 [Mycotypha africana]